MKAQSIAAMCYPPALGKAGLSVSTHKDFQMGNFLYLWRTEEDFVK